MVSAALPHKRVAAMSFRLSVVGTRQPGGAHVMQVERHVPCIPSRRGDLGGPEWVGREMGIQAGTVGSLAPSLARRGWVAAAAQGSPLPAGAQCYDES